MGSLQKAEQAHLLYRDLIAAIRAHRLFGVFLGKFLWQLRFNDTYTQATGIENWNDFLKSPEISLEVREANRAMDLYDMFVLQYGYKAEELAEAKTKSLHYLLPLAKSGEVPEKRIRELVEDAKHLTQNQFRDQIYDAKTGDQGPRSYQFVLMRKCIETGTLQLVPDVTNETIIQVFNHAGIPIEQKLQSMPEII